MIYGLALRIRHLFYDKGWKKSFSPEVPTICVGNVSAGGTGKTPHVEMILRMLVAQWKQPAVLSRGYKRKSKGFQIVPHDGSALQFGDEPVQIARKFPDITVAVDKDRIHGCEELRGAGVIVLDDAFQYRRLKPSLSIVLVDYNHPVFKDRLIPWGRLRDLPSRLKKADVVLVTKCPAYLDVQEREQWRKHLKLRADQPLFFTTLHYTAPVGVFPDADPHYIYSKHCTLITGIAHNKLFLNYLSDTYKIGRSIELPDHHTYTRADVRKMASAVKKQPTACLMTTEKDAQRLRDCKNMPEAVRKRLFYVPIEATFLSPEEESAFVGILEFAVKAD
ncbi:MAG: tetraacyldisaccharide 4'-kinase [Bacteroidales bacterium]|nr:tetraacyldisaccharide 4'-kinase [Bacteroidales bacterium]